MVSPLANSANKYMQINKYGERNSYLTTRNVCYSKKKIWRDLPERFTELEKKDLTRDKSISYLTKGYKYSSSECVLYFILFYLYLFKYLSPENTLNQLCN